MRGMRHLLLSLIMVGANAFANSETARPTHVVDKDGKILGDEADVQGASWKFIQRGDHLASEAVGQFFTENGPECTATVITPPNCPDPSKAKPQVITNGHCSRKSRGPYKMKFNGFQGVPDSRRPEISLKKVYSGENRMDVGVYELETSMDLLSNFGVKPARLAASMPRGKYDNLAMPLSEVKAENRNMRLDQACEAGAPTTIVDQFRYYTNVTPFKNCSAVGGSSGSGLFNASGELAGIMVAGVRSEAAKPPQHVCQTDTCVYDGTGAPFREEANFGFDVTYLAKCYKNCALDTNLAGCPLPAQDSAFGTTITRQDPVWHTSLNDVIQFSNPKFNRVHVKICPDAKTCSCQDSAGYVAGPTGRGDGRTYHLGVRISDYLAPGTPLTLKKGEPAQFRFMCLRGETPDGKLDDLKNTTNYPIWLYHRQRPF